MRRASTLVLLPLAFGACNDGTVPSAPDSSTEPVLSASGDIQAQVIPGQYIVVFRDDVADPPGLANRLVRQQGGSLRFTYQFAIKGFSAELPEKAVDALRRNPNVAYIEPNGRVWAVGSPQINPPWGLDRIDQPDGLDGLYSYTPDGTGVTAYILDTGILDTHTDFGGRASVGEDVIGDGQNGIDCNGHGTHVAGTVGGSTYGVAKNVDLVAVRVLDCGGNGTWDGVVAGIDWVTNDASGPSVANMSLSGGANSAVDAAVTSSVAAGVFYSVAAGNGNFVGRPQNACGVSPARVSEAATVGATESDDDEASFSNYGTCVDILAPGVGVLSAVHTGDNATGTKSGTSMAAPHVAGAAALYLDANANASPATVLSALTSNASTNKIDLHRSSSRNGTPNLLLYTGFLNGPVDNPPDVSITNPSEGATISGTVSVAAAASDDNSVTQVEFFVDGSSIGVDSDGSDGWSVNWNTAAGGDGGYALTAIATDDAAQPSSLSDPVNVTVNNSTGGAGTHAGDLDGSSTNQGRTWTAIVAIVVHDGSHATVGSGLTVSGTWSSGGPGGVCVTDSSGSCDVSVAGIRKNNGTVTFEVTSVSAGDYNAGANHDPDGDSDGTSITVSKP